MKRFTYVFIYRARFVGYRRFDFPAFAINDHVSRRGAVFLATPNELYSQSRLGKRFCGFVFVRPDVEICCNDDFSAFLHIRPSLDTKGREGSGDLCFELGNFLLVLLKQPLNLIKIDFLFLFERIDVARDVEV